MFPKVMKAYKDLGYNIDIGTPSRLFSVLIDQNEHRKLSCCGGFTVSDAFLFSILSKIFSPDNIFIIGNSFGLSTFVLAELFPNAFVDAIDAEIEGMEAQIGSDITRKISQNVFLNVQLTIGYSPQDIGKAARYPSYNLVFIDGLHQNEQLLLDFNGMLPYLDKQTVIIFHDVASCKMTDAWNEILSISKPMGFKGFQLGFTQMGCCALIRGYPDVIQYFEMTANDFDGPYLKGFKADDSSQYYRRPFFWDLSFGHIERLIKRKIRRIFKKNCESHSSI